MKNITLILILFFFFPILLFAGGKGSGRVSVSGYTRKNGTYVAPYTRSTPHSSNSNSDSSVSLPSLSNSSSILQDSVKVKGYTRSDGTYVRPYERSKPDDDLSNNYGQPSYQQRQEYKSLPTLPSSTYDYDNDGIKNKDDLDDDNDGVLDNYDKKQYNENEW